MNLCTDQDSREHTHIYIYTLISTKLRTNMQERHTNLIERNRDYDDAVVHGLASSEDPRITVNQANRTTNPVSFIVGDSKV